MQKNTYKTFLKKGQPAAKNALPQQGVVKIGTDVTGFMKVSSVHHLKLDQLLADWCHKNAP